MGCVYKIRCSNTAELYTLTCFLFIFAFYSQKQARSIRMSTTRFSKTILNLKINHSKNNLVTLKDKIIKNKTSSFTLLNTAFLSVQFSTCKTYAIPSFELSGYSMGNRK